MNAAMAKAMIPLILAIISAMGVAACERRTAMCGFNMMVAPYAAIKTSRIGMTTRNATSVPE